MQFYLNVFNESLNEGDDLRENGSLLFEKAANKIFYGKYNLLHKITLLYLKYF